MTPIIEFKHVTKAFPGVLALNDINLELKKGEIHAIMGENGAGKSTLIKTLSGINIPDKGQIFFEGKELQNITPKKAREMGITVIYQELTLVGDLTIGENVYLGELPRKGIFLDRKGLLDKMCQIFEELDLKLDPEMKVKDLTVGYQQMVEICRALAQDAKVLILDEPTASLSNKEADILFAFMEKARKKGITIAFISHRLDEVFRMSDRITVLRDGQMITTLNTRYTDRDELVRLMVGRKLDEIFKEREDKTAGKVVLEIQHLTGNGDRDISLRLHKGEILGLGGLVGAGRTELAEMIYGAVRPESGKILVGGREVTFRHPKDALKHSIVLMPEDRKQQGLILDMSVRENIVLSVLRHISTGIFVSGKKQSAMVDKYIDAIRIKTPTPEQKVKNLSGGNQQKVVLSKGLATEPEIIIIDEPTRGIDVGAKKEVYDIMDSLVAQGKSIIMISSDMEELLGMSDRIAVFCEGRLSGIISRDEFNAELVLKCASEYQGMEDSYE
ncbi:sugar ABC transporter ATP-binding protein [Ruminococcus gauvreauii]|uniref:Sugar ABC transporter ATP-binding protein n=1 Tax=Ruminococcus gauvreauii TaxID=438033 RepID=A0ABY5VCK5_9FIRM|nr:sugar ABC transporter ATP-binding protein [Ruminococcus gauvreauii]UWP57911.1 sugar ABC transporter ATP-binding protein [Ruminococcus gauvreauii]